MSGHPRDKHPSPVSTPSHKAPAPVPKNRNRELRADFLLNFQRPPAHQRPQAYAPPPRRSRPSGRQYGPVAFAKGRFVQSAFRLFVDGITPDVVEAALCADSLLKWESVCQVDLICEQPAKCPICLEVDMVVPKITKCGHAFCAPCILRYFLTLTDYNKKVYQRCPVCNEQVCPNELTSARFEEIKALRENDRTTFILVHRDANSTIVRTHAQSGPGDASGDPLRLPSRADRGWHFSRLVRLLPAEANRLLQEETEALESFRMVVQADGERELLPSIDAALDLTRQRQKRRAERGSSGPAEEDFVLPDPAVDLPEEEEEDVPDEPGDLEGDDVGSEPQTSPQYASQPSPSSPAIRTASSPVLGASQASPGAGQGRPQLISFYQASDGRLVFLEPFFTKLLLHEHGGRWDGLPPVLEELRLGRLQELSVSEEARRRHRFLQHLPLGTVVSLAEVDLRAHLSQETKDFFAEEFNKRRQQKKKDKTRDLRNQRIGKTRAAEEEERIYQALNLTRSAPIQQKPTAEDFAVPLPGREAEVVGEDGVAAEGAGAAGDEGEGEEEGGPTLAEKIKGRMAGKAKAKAKTKPRPMEDPATAFPQLGGPPVQAGAPARSSAGGGASSSTAASTSAGSSSAWGRGCGSSRVKKDKDAPDGSQPAGPTGTGWDDDEEAGGAGPADENPTFGQALEAALRSAEAEAEADQPTGEAGAGASAAGAKKKKGRAGKATTIRLFG